MDGRLIKDGVAAPSPRRPSAKRDPVPHRNRTKIITAFTSAAQDQVRGLVWCTRSLPYANEPMLKPLVLLFCLLSLPVAAADWTFEGGSTPIAYADNGDAQFQFACRGGDLAMAYWVRKPADTVAAAQSLSLAMNAGGGKVSAGSDTGFAQDFPIIHHDGSSVLIRGPVARQWARTAQQARESMELAFVKSGGSGGLDFLDRHKFGATGSSAAIAQVLSSCG